MVSFGFFNSSNGDRKYSADDVSRIFSYLITDGVLMTYGDKFFTTPATANLGVVLGTGWAWFNHTWTQSDTAIPFTLDEPDPSLDRFDTVYLKVDRRSLGRMNSLGVVKGTAAINPVVPTFPTETDVFYHPLAYVKVRHGVTRIAASDIEILVGKTQAPFITSILQTTDITTLFQGWSEQFGTKMNTWQSGYDAKMTEWENEVDTLETSLTANVNAVITSANQQLQTQQTQFTNQMASQQTIFTNSLNGWETDFQTWFDNLQTYLSEDVVTEIWADLQSLENNKADKSELVTKIDKANEWLSHINYLPFKGKTASGTNIPLVGDRNYKSLSDYSRVLSNNTYVNNNGVYLGPQIIFDAITKIPGFFPPIVMLESGAFTMPGVGLWITFILIGGGGGAGGYGYYDTISENSLHLAGGGGGAGGILISTRYVPNGATISVTVGAGGANGSMGGRLPSGSHTRNGDNGGTTSVVISSGSFSSTLTAYGGKGGTCSIDGIGANRIINLDGGNGGAGSSGAGFVNGGAGGGGGSLMLKNSNISANYTISAKGGDGSLFVNCHGVGGGGGGGGSIYIDAITSSSFPTPTVSGGYGYMTRNPYGGRGGYVIKNGTSTFLSSSAASGSPGLGSEGGLVLSSTYSIPGGGGGGGISNSGHGGSNITTNVQNVLANVLGGGGGGGVFAEGGGKDLTQSSWGVFPTGIGAGGYGGSQQTGYTGCSTGGGGGGWGLFIPDSIVTKRSTVSGRSGGVIMIMNGGYG